MESTPNSAADPKNSANNLFPASAPALACPVPLGRHERVTMAHGGGGRLTQDLQRRLFLPAFRNPALEAQGDGARLDLATPRVVLTTDSYVVRPIFFPGGDIGSLAVHGTINDLAVSGARPEALTASFILEEGLPMADLRRVVESMRAAMAEAGGGLRLVAGDTKVIERGAASGGGADGDNGGPGLMIGMAGLGERVWDPPPGAERIRAGDVILVSGPLGDHGMAVMCAREGFAFDAPIVSDSRPLWGLVHAMMSVGGVRCMRDLTRGGLASALNELADAAALDFYVRESEVPVRPQVHAACELLGFDPMYVACEGTLVAFVEPDRAEDILALMRAAPGGARAAIIGEARPAARATRPEVLATTAYGAERPLDMLSGEQLPRIC